MKRKSALIYIKEGFSVGANVRSYGEFAGMAQFNFWFGGGQGLL